MGKLLTQVTDDGRVCTQCLTHKPWDSYHRSNRHAINGRHSQCKSCVNSRRTSEYVHDPVFGRKLALAYKYGMTPADYERMVTGQGNACAICQKQMVKPCIDHNHETGKVRGLLCHGCNIKLAAIEQVDYRISALAYLERYK